jgi:hypothetical protein
MAGLKTLEKPRFLTPSKSVMTPPAPRLRWPVPTPRESPTPQIHIKVGTCSIRACPAIAAVPLFPLWLTPTEQLMRNHHDSPQPTGSWTAVALHRFPICVHRFTLSDVSSQPKVILLCVFASLREAFLPRLSPGTPSVLLRFWTLVASYRLNGRLYLQKYIFSKPATHNPLHTLKR